MASEGTWMPLYIGDYLADTMHLASAEHGAYLLLIMHYWRTGPLPDDDKILATIARTERREWTAEIGPIVRAFFRPADGKLYHKRIDNELAAARGNIEQRRAAGRASAEQRARQRGANENDNARPNEMVNENPTGVDPPVERPLPDPLQRNTQRKGNSSPSPSPSDPPSPDSLRSSASVKPDDPDFDRFWGAYPRKEDKGHARKAWKTALSKATVSAIIEGLSRARFNDDPKFRPLAATWLNGERWSDAGGPPINGHAALPLANAEPGDRIEAWIARNAPDRGTHPNGRTVATINGELIDDVITELFDLVAEAGGSMSPTVVLDPLAGWCRDGLLRHEEFSQTIKRVARHLDGPVRSLAVFDAALRERVGS